MRRLVTLLVILAIVGTAAACNQTPAAPELTNAREIVVRTIESTAGLRSMRVRIDVEIHNRENPGVSEGGSAEGVLDLGTGEMSIAGAEVDGSGAFAIIQADGAAFARNTPNGRWTKIPAMGGIAAIFLLGGGGGPPVDTARALADLAADPATTSELRGVEDCPTGRCYRTTVQLLPAQVWKLIVRLTGIDKMQGGVGMQQQPPDIPPVSLEILTDTATLRLVDMVVSGAANGSTAALRLRVAAPNEPVAIEPPPPGLVDNPGVDMGGGGVPAPAPPVVGPVRPVPVESIGP